jgi:myo-inositol-1(or 4)-monophosphatase
MIGRMPDADPQDLLSLAKRLADDAARLLLSGESPSDVRLKADDSVVTETDHAIQDHILHAVAQAYPNHAVCAEETVSQPDMHSDRLAARYCWVVDPIDGTRNYASGLPCFGTSIAVLDRGRPVVGVVTEHNLGHVYAAVRGGGATLNGEPVQVTDPTRHGDVLIGIPSSKDELTVRVLQSWVATEGLVLRNLGSTALHLAMVASGALDAAFCKRAKIWDVAAGTLLVTEAGGRITDPVGRELCPFDLNADPNEDIPTLAAAPPLHERLLQTTATAVRS